MKNTKKVLSTTLAAAMLLSMTSFAFANPVTAPTSYNNNKSATASSSSNNAETSSSSNVANTQAAATSPETYVYYVGQGTEQYYVRVPAKMTPTLSTSKDTYQTTATVEVAGEWMSTRSAVVYCPQDVTITNSINSSDTKTLKLNLVVKNDEGTTGYTAGESDVGTQGTTYTYGTAVAGNATTDTGITEATGSLNESSSSRTATAISMTGDNNVPVAYQGTVSIQDINDALFGVWSGTFKFSVKMESIDGYNADNYTTTSSDITLS
jgi:hypothetical protein